MEIGSGNISVHACLDYTLMDYSHSDYHRLDYKAIWTIPNWTTCPTYDVWTIAVWTTNIAKGTTDPKIAFISHKITVHSSQVLNILQFQN